MAEILRVRRMLHELSNVLTGVLITAGLLKNFVPLSGNGGRYAGDLELSAERAAGLVSEVRASIHALQALAEASEGEVFERTKVCDVRPSLGQESRED
jgi:glutamine synthetase type III